VSAAAAVDYVQQVKPLLQSACVKCHGATAQKGKVRLDTAAAAFLGGQHGTSIISGDAEKSLLIQAVEGTHGEISKMPYKRPPLDATQIALLKQWIKEGALAPKDEQPSDDRHWAFLKPVRASDFDQQFQAWHKAGNTGNEIDFFVRARLAKDKLSPSPEAAPETLVRRVTFDLIGLPPTPEEVLSFVAEYAKDREAAMDALVTRLLESPHYGERWGRWWLDQARYADSNGYSIDAPRSIWPYRDWVIQAMNRDEPFDQFTIDQLAGDLLPKATLEQKIATGFHRNTQVNGEGGIDPEQFRVESVVDRVNTTGAVWLGVTIGCCQCHDHKFDPFPQRDYYGLFAFFNSCEQDGHGGTKTSTVTLPPVKDEGALQLDINNLRFDMERYFRDNTPVVTKALEDEKKLTAAQRAKLSKPMRDALAKPYLERSLTEQRLGFEAVGVKDRKFVTLNKQLKDREAGISQPLTTLVLQELPKPRETHLFIKGDFTRPDALVDRAVPAILHPLPKSTKAMPDRLDLARWIASPENPLTARVIMNRVWLQYFGRGIVETENDFGTMGAAPTHPELLDWLATEFIKRKWSLKAMHRAIVMSHTYRQSSTVSKDNTALTVDANNYLLWQQRRLRLDAELVRDACLAESGLLSEKMGGPPVYPPIPEGVMSLGQVKRAWPVSKGEDRYRRGIYTFFFRATPPPSLSVFDAPDGFSTCTRRLRSNTPLQALTLLNDTGFDEFAKALAARLQREVPSDDTKRIEHGFLLCTARKPSATESQRLLKVLADERTAGADDSTAWQALARVLLNLDETVTRE
jgi:mono/diheme cytochrome c family protein